MILGKAARIAGPLLACSLRRNDPVPHRNDTRIHVTHSKEARVRFMKSKSGLWRLDNLWRRLLDQSRPRQQELLVRGLGAGAQDHRQTYARRRIVPSDARCDRRCVGDRFQLRQRAVDGFHAEFTISPIAIISFFRLEKVSSTPRRRTNFLGISGSK